MPVDIYLRVPPCAPAIAIAAFARRVEEAGFYGIGIPDTQLLLRDAYVTMALVAEHTATLRIHTSVTNPVTRHPSVLACLARTVDEIAPGRIGIVIGSGYSSVRTIGQQPATIQQIREAVLAMHGLLAGETVNFNGFRARLPFAGEHKVPIYIAATGPRTIELAGEIADGAMLQAGFHPAMMAAAWRHLEAGARRMGRDPRSLDIIWDSAIHVAANMETAWNMSRPLCGQWVIESKRFGWLKETDIKVPSFKVPPELQNLYPDLVHAENPEDARRLTSFLPDELIARMADAIGIFGTPDHCAQRIHAMAQETRLYQLGKLHLRTMETYTLPEDTVRVFKNEIFPRLAALESAT